MAGIWIFAEKKELVLELLTPGGELAARQGGKLTIVVPEAEGDPADYFAAGADEVVLLSPLAEDVTLGAWLPVLAGEIRAADPEAVLLAATSL